MHMHAKILSMLMHLFFAGINTKDRNREWDFGHRQELND